MKIDLKGLNELSKRVKKLDGENIVHINELFSKEFLEKYSCFSNFDEMIDSSGFKLENENDFDKLSENEEIVGAIPVKDFKKKVDIVIASKKGMIKKTPLQDFKVNRYTKPMTCMKLKSGDEVISVFEADKNELFVATRKGYGLWFDVNEVPESGTKSSGVKSINLKDDEVINVNNFDNSLEYVTVFTDKGTAKRIKLEEFEKTSRAKRGLIILREVKTNPYYVIGTILTDSRSYIGIKKDEDISVLKNTEIPISDRYKTGSTISKQNIDAVFVQKKLETLEESSTIEEPEETKEEVIEQPHQISLLEIDDKLKEISAIIKDNR